MNWTFLWSVIAAVAFAVWLLRRGSGGEPTLRAEQVSQDEQGVRMLISAGEKIQAIKLARTLTRSGLKEAKEMVDAMERGEAVNFTALPSRRADLPPELEAEIRTLLLSGRTIEAIKIIRDRTALGLKEAKEMVEAMLASGSPPKDSP